MKKYKYIFISLFVFLSITSIFAFINRKELKLKITLESSSYSYLPKEAMNYVEEIYNETGQIISTEKNKEKNVPYLNPDFINYLTLSDEEKKQVEDVPSIYRVDPILPEVDGSSIPSTYDLRSVNGQNYTTPLRNQGGVGVCWAFAAAEQVESLLLLQSNTPYSSGAEIFSARQMDYAASNNGIINYSNTRYGYRELTEGGTFLSASTLMANGVALNHESDFPYDESTDKKPIQDVLNYDNAQYELMDSEVLFLDDYQSSQADFDNYLNTIKLNVMSYGGAYVSTQAPNKSCGSRNYNSNPNYNNTQIIRVDNSCVKDSGHAMQIIGWDDNYTYSYCKAGTFHSINTSSCSQDNLVTGTGAWILRNSWGNSTYSYVYLAYDSNNGAVYFSKDVRSMSEKTWDTVYNEPVDYLHWYVTSEVNQQYERETDIPEKIVQVKFHTFSQNGNYNISVYSPTQNYVNVKNVTVNELGYTTVDLSSYNIYITDSEFIVTVSSTNNGYILTTSVTTFTSTVDKYPILEYDHLISDYANGGYQFYLKPYSRNIPSNTEITYALYDSKGTNVSSRLTYNSSKIAINNSVVYMYISGSLPQGVYTLKAYYGDYEYESKFINITGSYLLDGSGTQEDPFLVRTEDDLRKVSIYMDAYYKLVNNITLQNRWVPIGIETNPFEGTFDGQGYTISNINVTGTYKNAGLFGAVKSANIKNLVIENATVKGESDSGILIGTITGEGIYDSTATQTTMDISNISIRGGSVISNNGAAGSLIGSTQTVRSPYKGTQTYDIKRVFSNATITGKTASGIIGKVNGGSSSNDSPAVHMENIENIGIIDLNPLLENNITPESNTHASLIGTMKNMSLISMSNYISNPLFKGFTQSGLGVYGSKSSTTIIVKNSGYNTLDGNTTALDLKQTSNYNSWTSFSNYWKMETIDSISRIPILNNTTINYTSLSNITLEKGESIKISDIVGEGNLARVHASSNSNSNAVTLTPIVDTTSNKAYDLQINGVEAGETIIHLISDYDGYENNIIVSVVIPMESFTIPDSSIELDIDDEYTVVPTFIPSDTTESTVITWTSSTPGIVSITNNVVKGLSYGTTVLTGSLPNGKEVTLNVTCKEIIHLTGVVVSNTEITLNPNDTWALAVQFNPSNTTDNTDIEWRTSNDRFATVVNGVVTAHEAGTAVVSGELENGMKIFVTVNVVNEPVSYNKGDLNRNGSIDINDVIIALKKIFGYSPADEKDLEIGDITENDEIDINDVIRILKYFFGYIDEL